MDARDRLGWAQWLTEQTEEIKTVVHLKNGESENLRNRTIVAKQFRNAWNEIISIGIDTVRLSERSR